MQEWNFSRVIDAWVTSIMSYVNLIQLHASITLFRCQELERYTEKLQKNHRHEFGIERARHKETQKQLEETTAELEKLKTQLKVRRSSRARTLLRSVCLMQNCAVYTSIYSQWKIHAQCDFWSCIVGCVA